MRTAISYLALVLCLILSGCGQPTSLDFNAVLKGPILEANVLDSLMHSPNNGLRVLDVRPAAEYLAGHIPGAINVWRPALSDHRHPFSSITAPKNELESLFGKMGLGVDLPLVVYDGKMNADAANLWWIFDLEGKKNVQILDGGLLAWQKAGYATETDSVVLPITIFQFPNAGDSSHYASLSAVVTSLNDPNTILIDTRTKEEYSGEMVKEGAKKGGHIPGSKWLNYTETTTEKNGCFFLKSISELEALFQAKGITPDKDIICYCHSGVRSAHMTFVLSKLLGFPSVRNFDGSWEEWTHHDFLPIALGSINESKPIN